MSQTGHTFEGPAPTHGAHTSDGKLFCGSYSNTRWRSDDMAPFRSQIMTHRATQPGYSRGSGRDGERGGQAERVGRYQKAKRKLDALQIEHATLNRTLAALQSTGGTVVATPAIATVVPTSSDVAATNTNAGDAFGGRESMQGRPGSNH